MFNDFEITIQSTAPTTDDGRLANDNVLVRYKDETEPSMFNANAILNDLEQLLAPKPSSQDALTTTGTTLFDALFTREIYALYDRAIKEAQAQRRTLRLHLNTRNPAVAAIRWEYLYHSKSRQWPVLRPDVSFLRSLPVESRPQQPMIPPTDDLRILVMISDPSDQPPLKTEREWNAMTGIAEGTLMAVERVDPTLEALQGALRRYAPHIFHFIGHGLFDQNKQTGTLCFKREDGCTDYIQPRTIATALAHCPSLRLTFLNACDSATPGIHSAFAGVAQTLIEQGMSAVVAMQAPILDGAALAFSQEFYRALADGFHMEAAMDEGRTRLLGMETRSRHYVGAWGIPTLYSQGHEPIRLAQVDDAEKVARLWRRVQALPTDEHNPHFDSAQKRRLVDRILQIDPDYAEAKAVLAGLDTFAKAKELYAETQRQISQEAWQGAHDTLQSLERLRPNFRDTVHLRSQVVGHLHQEPQPTPPDAKIITPPPDLPQENYDAIVDALARGRLIPFLGGEVNRIGHTGAWVHGLYPPTINDVAQALVDQLSSPLAADTSLLQAAQVTDLLDGEQALYDRLSDLYQHENYQPGMVHRLLAEIATRIYAHQSNTDRRYILFSTAFDNLLERSFDEAKQPYHLFAYRPRFTDEVDDGYPECFVHTPPTTTSAGTVSTGFTQEPVEVLKPEEYDAHKSDNYPIILKLCGERITTEPESVLVTEDQFLRQSSGNIRSLLPRDLINESSKCNFLFFGHTLQLWHLRQHWQRLRPQTRRRKPNPNWAIVSTMTPIEREFWQEHGVKQIEAAPETLVAYLYAWMEENL
ncbi:MAG: CHAT domain-containing protein [Chloroflexota bacterium]